MRACDTGTVEGALMRWDSVYNNWDRCVMFAYIALRNDILPLMLALCWAIGHFALAYSGERSLCLGYQLGKSPIHGPSLLRITHAIATLSCSNSPNSSAK